jgi:HEAT repeat protein
LLDAETPGVPLAAAYALGQLGTAAKPATEELKKLADAEEPLQQTVALWALARANPKDKQWFDLAVPLLVERLTDADQQVREAAVRALADLEPPPGSLIPELKRVLDKADAETVSGALDALATLGEPAVPRLIAALEHDDARARAAAILGRIGPPAQEAVPALRDVLDDPDGEVRREAAFALGAMGEAASPAVPQLTELLQDPDMNVRYAAAYALGKIGPQAMEAKSELVKRLASPDRFLGLVAAWALARVHPECPATSPKSVPVLVKALEQPAPMVQLEAIEALRCLGPLAKDALPGLRELAESTDNAAIRQAAADAIEAIEK